MRRLGFTIFFFLSLLTIAAAPSGCAGLSIVPPGPGGSAATATPTNTPTNTPTPPVTVVLVVATPVPPTPTLPPTDTPTPTQTALPTQTLTPTPTPTQTAASVGTPSRVASPTSGPSLTPVAGMTVTVTIKVDALKVFESADDTSVVVGFLKKDQVVTPHGRTDGWLQVTAENGKVGFIYNGTRVSVTGDLTALPIVRPTASHSGSELPWPVSIVSDLLKWLTGSK